jgi:hypothetical protein
MKWFNPQCPVSEAERRWIEQSSSWLIDQFGIKARDVAVVLPTPDFFPDRYTAEEEDVEALVKRVCDYMGVSRERLELELVSDQHRELRNHLPMFESAGRRAAGQFMQAAAEGSIRIRISTDRLNDPMSLIATIAHELGHVLLLADGKISRERADHEQLTDLLTVWFGLGIFTANSVFKFSQWSGGFKQGWESRRLGYLNEQMFGYALAWFACARGESNPAWAKHLEGNSKHYFRSSLRFLRRRGQPALREG